MNILHYTLGLPPYRTGGLTAYSIDLIKSQKNFSNQNISLIFPGRYTLNKKEKIKSLNNYFNIQVYELINPLPVPLLGGIQSPIYFNKTFSEKLILEFLKKVKPDVIHIHTLMGLPKEFLTVSKKLNIKTVFTTHDFFGLCFKVNFVFNECLCKSEYNSNKCAICNINGYNINLIRFMQSRFYRNIKKTFIFKLLKKKNKFSQNKVTENNKRSFNKRTLMEYDKLHSYYKEMFYMIDFFHFNSSISKMQFESILGKLNGQVINITHSKIKDNRMIKHYVDNSKLKITYLGAFKEYKGLNLLLDSLNELKKHGYLNWELNLYGGDINDNNINNKKIKYNGKYDYKDLKKIFSQSDVVVIPSICRETFGFVGLEAYSYGVPIIITENVGMKDIIKKNVTGMIVKPNKESLSKSFMKILDDRQILVNINKRILETNFDFNIEKHVMNVFNMYENVLKIESSDNR